MNWLTRTIRQWRRSQRGGTAIEFAIVAPIFLFCAYALSQVGFAIYSHSTLNQIAEQGARHLLFSPGDQQGARQIIIDKMAGSGIDPAQVAIAMHTEPQPYPHVELRLDYLFKAVGPFPLPQDIPLSAVVLVPVTAD